MKKGVVIYLYVIVSLLVIPIVLAATDDPAQALAAQTGINPDKIPQDADELKARYLQQEWVKLVENHSFFGPIHRSAVNNPTWFKVFFAQEYSFSKSFLILFILWVFTLTLSADFIKRSGFVSSTLTGTLVALALGLCAAVIAAQMRLLAIVNKIVLALFFSKSSPWFTLILSVVFVGALIVLFYLEQLLGQYLQKNKEAREKSKLNQDVTNLKELKKGIEEGTKLKEK